MNRKVKKELVEWSLFLTVIGVIYLGGFTTEVAGFFQRLVISTGVIQPSQLEETKQADYDFELMDINEQTVPFSSFEGKVVFLNLWATWCPPCIAEMPDIQSLYEERDDIEFVMVSLDKDFQKAKSFVEKKAFTFPIYTLSSPIPTVFSSSSIPTTFLIDKQGNVVIANQGMAKYNTNKFKTFLDELSLKPGNSPL